MNSDVVFPPIVHTVIQNLCIFTVYKQYRFFIILHSYSTYIRSHQLAHQHRTVNVFSDFDLADVSTDEFILYYSFPKSITTSGQYLFQQTVLILQYDLIIFYFDHIQCFSQPYILQQDVQLNWRNKWLGYIIDIN